MAKVDLLQAQKAYTVSFLAMIILIFLISFTATLQPNILALCLGIILIATLFALHAIGMVVVCFYLIQHGDSK